MSTDLEQVLEALVAQPSAERVAFFRAQLGTSDDAAGRIAEFADRVEQLAVTEVSQAQATASILVQLAEELDMPAALARALRAQGQSLAYGARFKEALAAFERAIAVADAHDLRMEGALARMSAIHPLALMGLTERIPEFGEAARVTFMELGNVGLAARVDANLGVARLESGDPRGALEHFDRTRPLLAANPAAVAQVDSNRGHAFLQLEAYDEAATAFQQALPVFVRDELHWAAAIVEGNLADLKTRQGRMHEALAHFEQTRRHLEADHAPGELARVLCNHAEALLLIGLVEEAHAQFSAALSELDSTGQQAESIRARAGLGEALLRLDRIDEADQVVRQAMDQLGDNDRPALQSRLELLGAEVAVARADFEAAELHAERALRSIGERPVANALTRALLAQIAFERGALPEAERHLEAAVPVVEALDITPLRAEMRYQRGMLRRARGQLADALCDLRDSVEFVERGRGMLQAERLRAAFHGNRLRMYAALVSCALEEGTDEATRLALDTVERAKSRALLDLTRQAADPVELALRREGSHEAQLARRLLDKRSQLDALYSRLAEERFADQAASEGGDRAAIRTLEQTVAELESRLASVSDRRGLLGTPRSTDELQGTLDPDSAILEYYVVDGYFWAFLIDARHVQTFARLATVADVADLAKRIRFQMNRGLRGAGGGPRAARMLSEARRELGQLYDRIFRPVADGVGRRTKLRIVPHGALHTVPFNALWDGEQYLIDRFELRFSPSASLFTGATDADRAALRTLIVGVADERAPRIEDEARTLHEALDAEQLLVGADATVERVRTAMESADWVHVACHGQYAADVPMASGIKLADRWLTVREIHELRLRAQLVTLSGCETGRSAITHGDELIGLVRPFLAAGAERVLVSLWTVSDEGTAALMSSFYRQLKRTAGTEAIGAALRAAQREQMVARGHPSFWAPFIIVG